MEVGAKRFRAHEGFTLWFPLRIPVTESITSINLWNGLLAHLHLFSHLADERLDFNELSSGSNASLKQWQGPRGGSMYKAHVEVQARKDSSNNIKQIK